MRWHACSVMVLLVMLGIPMEVFGQAAAELDGTAVDESAAVLPGVTVVATELSTGRSYVAVTDGQGEYRVFNMAPGLYRVEAQLPGFATVVVPNLELLVGQNATIPFVLEVAGVEETITVLAESPLVDIRTAEVAGNVDRRQLESMPLQGRNWLELAMLVKGITDNEIGTTPGVRNQDQFNLTIDGQQVSQRIGSRNFGQVRFGRESIAEFEIATNMYDITAGRSTGMQVKAISKAGTNLLSGSAYGYFRDDKLNSADHIAKRVLPYQNQQVGVSVGGPILTNKLFFFGSYEYEREPFTALAQPPLLPNQKFAFPAKNTTKTYLLRGDYQVSDKDHVSFRWGRHHFLNPFLIQQGTYHPSRVTINPISSNNSIGAWTRVHSNNRVSELRAGFSGFFFLYGNRPELECPSLGLSLDEFKARARRYTCHPFVGTPYYSFPGGLAIGPRSNQLNDFNQHNWQFRYDTTWVRGDHEFKIGGEFIKGLDDGWWHNIQRGVFTFHTLPPDLDRRFPMESWNDPSAWDVSGLEPYVQRFTQSFHPNEYFNDVPRPVYAAWIGDRWAVNDRLTLNYGVRYDLDWGAHAPRGIVDRDIFIDNGQDNGNFGFKSDVRDLNDVSPRFGFAYDVQGTGRLVIRGGSGLYYSTPDSGSVYSHQLSNQQISGSWDYDGKPGFMEDPRRGVTAEQMLACNDPTQCVVTLPPQVVNVRARDFANPYTWQNTIGFQQQLGPTTAFDVDLVQWIWYDDRRRRDVNLFFDPDTGYNKDPRVFGRPNPDYGAVRYSSSDGRREYWALANSLTRRLHNNLQAGGVYTLMFQYDDTRNIGGDPDNPFDRDAEWARSSEFQRHTLRAYAIYQLPGQISLSGAYFYGSGNYFNTRHPSAPYGKPSRNNRLNLGPPVTIPEAARDRYDGPSVIGTGEVVPRNALRGFGLHRVDLRITKDLVLGGGARLSLMAEVFNLFNHENYGNYTATVTSGTFGEPRPNDNNAYFPRIVQLGIHMRF